LGPNPDEYDDSDEATLETMKFGDPEELSARSVAVPCEGRQRRTMRAVGLMSELAGRKGK